MDQRSRVVIAFLSGVILALGAALVVQSGLPEARAQGASGGGLKLDIGVGTQGQSRDVVFVLDGEARRMGVYEYKDGRLSLGAVRNMEYDFRFETWSPRGKEQRPTVKAMKDASEKRDEQRSSR